ncbi:MAG: AMP-binding protein [Halofilum sp. (in: g-proteobacteria)]|nr:AMP-binding protein [Halofilum sp. (in: g-proteobacteria)]
MDRVWLKHYQPGVPAEIDADAFPSVGAVFEQACSRFADRDAFHCMGAALTFAQFDARSRDFAAYLQHELGLEKGDRVALMMPNCMQYPVALYGVLRAGLVVVNVNPLYTARELEHQLRDARPRAIVIVENFCHTLADERTRALVDHVVVTGLGDMLGGLKGTLVNLVVRHVKRMVPKWSLPGAVRWREALARGGSCNLSPPDVGGDDLAFLQYTGGTTGLAKGAMLTHRNMVANLEQISVWLGSAEGSEVVITPLPLYHIFSLTANLLNFVKQGATNVLITNPRDIPDFVKTLRGEPFTAMTGVNTLFNALLHNEDFHRLDFSRFRLAVGGGMAVQRKVAEEWQRVTGTVLIEGYGLTETAPVVCANPLDITAFTGTIGVPLPSTDVTVRDGDGTVLGVDEPGELCVRGPQVMKGYWEQPEETRQAFFDDAWFRTGDIAVIDAEGWVRIVDRKKDMIVVSGFNVYPNEVEDVAVGFEGVLEAACVGVPDEEAGEIVKLFVVAETGHEVDTEALRRYCRERLTGYKVPKRVEVRSELPTERRQDPAPPAARRGHGHVGRLRPQADAGTPPPGGRASAQAGVGPVLRTGPKPAYVAPRSSSLMPTLARVCSSAYLTMIAA